MCWQESTDRKNKHFGYRDMYLYCVDNYEVRLFFGKKHKCAVFQELVLDPASQRSYHCDIKWTHASMFATEMQFSAFLETRDRFKKLNVNDDLVLRVESSDTSHIETTHIEQSQVLAFTTRHVHISNRAFTKFYTLKVTQYPSTHCEQFYVKTRHSGKLHDCALYVVHYNVKYVGLDMTAQIASQLNIGKLKQDISVTTFILLKHNSSKCQNSNNPDLVNILVIDVTSLGIVYQFSSFSYQTPIELFTRRMMIELVRDYTNTGIKPECDFIIQHNTYTLHKTRLAIMVMVNKLVPSAMWIIIVVVYSGEGHLNGAGLWN